MICCVDRLTSHDSNGPPERTTWSSHAPRPDIVTGRHLISMESDDTGGSEADRMRDEFTTPEMGSIVPARDEKGQQGRRRGEKL
jgi:hypothetical protein